MPRTRYELRKTSSGWSVWDRAVDTPAAIDGVWQVGFQLEVADDLMKALNWLHDRAPMKVGAT